MRKSIMYVGMDQHHESIKIATADRRTAAGCNRAEADAGSHRPATKTTKSSPARSNTPSAAAKELKSFETILLSGLKVGLPRPAPRQAPQSAHREDDGEEPEHANREQRPDEKEVSAGIGEPAGDADALPHYVDVGDDQ